MNTRQKACRICCPAKTRRDRVECRLTYGQCLNAQKIQEGLDIARDERNRAKVGISWVDPCTDKG
jgi:hypothetical protein